MRLIDGRLNGREISRQFLVKTMLLLYGTIVNGRSRTNGYWYVEYKQQKQIQMYRQQLSCITRLLKYRSPDLHHSGQFQYELVQDYSIGKDMSEGDHGFILGWR